MRDVMGRFFRVAVRAVPASLFVGLLVAGCSDGSSHFIPADEPPTAVLDDVATTEDTAIEIDVLANDEDPRGLSLGIVEVVSEPANGTAVISPNGTITYTPDPEFFGIDEFSYTVANSAGLTSDPGGVVLTVLSENDLPMVLDDLVDVAEDASVDFDVTLNDEDIEDGSPSVSGFTQGMNGTVTLTPGGLIRYQPDPDFNGNDEFTYTAVDSDGASADGTVSISVTPVDDPPVATDDDAITPEDTSIVVTVLANDVEVDGEALAVTLTLPPTAGSAVVNPDGTITYLPAPDTNGTDNFAYSISDGISSDEAVVTVGVTSVNDAPTLQSDSATTAEDNAVIIPVLTNDMDVEGDPLTIVGATPPTSGAIVVNGDFTITYTPDTNSFGTDTFDYTVSDGLGGISSATVTVMVTSVNDAPIAQNDTTNTPEDSPVTIAVLANDLDVDGPSLQILGTPVAANGVVTVNPDGSLTYTPAMDFNGQDTFDYVVSDGSLMDMATVSVEVIALNDAPTTVDDEAVVEEDPASPLIVDVLANDGDVDGDTLSIDFVAQPAHGVVTLASPLGGGNPLVAYTPDPDFTGDDAFAYTVSDGNGGAANANVSIFVQPVDDDPRPEDDLATTDEDVPVNIVVLANDLEVDGESLIVVGTTAPANGSVTVEADQSITYTPDPEFSGADSFTYTVRDDSGSEAAADVAITVDALNDDPIAVDDLAQTAEDTSTSVPVLANDSDPDGDPLAVVGVTPRSNGTVTIEADGSLTYTPAPGFFGEDSFEYTLSDGLGGTASASVTVVVDAVNDPPVAADDGATVAEDDTVVIPVLANDLDEDGDPLSISSITPGPNGTAIANAGGTITFTPNPDFNGPESFSYTVTDGTPGGTDSGTVTVFVLPVNDAPVAFDDLAQTAEDLAVIVNVVLNDQDVDGDPLSVASVTPGPNGAVVPNGDGTVTFTPVSNFNGEETFSYVVVDDEGASDSAQVTVVVSPANDPPTAVSDALVTDEDVPATVDVLANDFDPDQDPLVILQVTSGEFGTATLVTPLLGSGASILYTPGTDFNGADSFSYTITDGFETSTAEVFVVVNPLNDDPVATSDAAMTDEDTPLSIPVLTNDTDVDGDTLAVIGVESGQNGVVVINGDGTVLYTPAPDFNGQDAFQYSISDLNGGSSTTDVTVFVNSVNDGPMANDDQITTDEDESIQLTPLDNDTDPEGEPLTVVGTSDAANGIVTLNSGGIITYSPNANFFGTDQFVYMIADTSERTDSATVFVTVTSVNDLPIANADAAATSEDVPVNVDVTFNDQDVDGDPLTVDSFGQGENGFVTLSPDGTLRYEPAPDFNGQDSFGYTVSDGNGGLAPAVVSLTVAPENDPPMASDDETGTPEDSPITIAVLANDQDPDGDTLSLQDVGQGAHGTVVPNPDGTVTYTPGPDFNGDDTFVYFVMDPTGASDSATVFISVSPVNDPPVAADDGGATAEDTAMTFTVLANDSDVENDSLSVTAFSQAANGSVAEVAPGVLEYTPAADFFGNDSFTYTASDGSLTDMASVTIEVQPVNDAPTAVADTSTTSEDNSVTIEVLLNDDDVDGDGLSVESVSPASNGSAAIGQSGEVIYTPDPDFNGLDTFSYTVSDGNGGSDTTTVTVTIDPVGDPPVAQPDMAMVPEDGTVAIPVLANDQDVDGDLLGVIDVDAPEFGAAVLNPDGTVQYTPDPDASGSDSFAYTISDGDPTTADATGLVSVEVDAVNDPPVADDDVAQTAEDTAVVVDVLANDDDIDGDTLTIVNFSQASGGTVSPMGSGLLYTPSLDFNGIDSFTYVVSDGTLVDSATVTIAVAALNDAPVAVPDVANTAEEVPVTVAVLSNDFDVDGDTLILVSAEVTKTGGSAQANPDGTVTFFPDMDYNGTAEIFYEVSDGIATSTGELLITVLPVNDPPTAVADSVQVDEDVTVSVLVLANDDDPDGDALQVAQVFQPENGTATLLSDGATIDYTPNANYAGDDTFQYLLADGNGGSDLGTVSVVVLPVPDAPVAVDDIATTLEDTTVVIAVLENDSDADGDPLLIVSASSNGLGAVTISDDQLTLIYDPAPNSTATDVLMYSVSDGDPSTADGSALVFVAVTPVNDAPIAVDDMAQIDASSSLPLTISVLDNDLEVDGEPLTITAVTNPMFGQVGTDGQTITYFPFPPIPAVDTFEYTVTDGSNRTATATVTITPINPVVPQFTFFGEPQVTSYEVPDCGTQCTQIFSTALFLGEDPDSPGFPNAISGFTMSLSNDPGRLIFQNLSIGADLQAVNGGNGPDFFSLTEFGDQDGFEAGVVISLPGADFLLADTPQRVFDSEYETQAFGLVGNPQGVNTVLSWSTPPANNNNVLAAGSTAPATTEDISILLTPDPLPTEEVYFLAPGRSFEYDPDNPFVTICEPLYIQQGDSSSAGIVFSGWQMNLAHPSNFTPISIDPSPLLDLFGGPTTFIGTILADQITLIGELPVQVPALAPFEVAVITYDVDLSGASGPVTTSSLQWVNQQFTNGIFGVSAIPLGVTTVDANAGTMTFRATGDTSDGAPTVDIRFPPPGTLTNFPAIRVSGEARDSAGVASVLVNGFPALTDNGFRVWNAALAPIQGTYPINVTARDYLCDEDLGAASTSVTLDLNLITGPSAIDRDPITDAALFIESSQRALGRVDPSTGAVTFFSSDNMGSGPSFGRPVDLVTNPQFNLVIVVDAELDAVLGVSPITGDRLVLSGPTVGQGPPLELPTGIVLENSFTDVLVTDLALAAVVRVDLIDGQRTIVSGTIPGIPPFGSGPNFALPFDLALDVQGNRVFVVDQALDAVFQVDLATGNRTIVSDATLGSGPGFDQPVSIDYSSSLSQALVTDFGLQAVVVVDFPIGAQFGNRSILSGAGVGTGIALFGPFGVAYRGDLENAYVGDIFSKAVINVELSGGDRNVEARTTVGNGPLLPFPRALDLDATGNRVVVVDPLRDGLLEVNLSTGDRGVISGPTVGSGPVLDTPVGVSLWLDDNSALVVDQGLDAVLSVDLTSGARTVISGDTVGSGPAFETLESIVVVSEDSLALVLDQEAGLFSVDLSTGNRMVLSGPTTGGGTDFIFPQHLALDRGGNRVFIVDVGLRAVLSVDLGTGFRTVISDDSHFGPPFAFPREVVYDPAQSRLIVGDAAEDTLFAVDITGGSRVRLSGPGFGIGPSIYAPDGVVYHPESQQAVVLAGGVYVVDLTVLESDGGPPTGDRVLRSQ